MPTVHFLVANGEVQSVEVPDGQSIMQAARQASISGIIAECGGSAMCGTCHVYVEERFLERLKPIDSVEEEILVAVPPDRRPNSRLSCQLTMTSDLDGIVVRVPEN
jgi:2Fe-2S ferredoxin